MGPAAAFENAERHLFEACGVQVTSRRVRLADPPVDVRVLETGEGPPLVLVHGSGMSATTWAPLMAHLASRRLIALDLPGFGLSDPFDYSGRPLREHAVAQLTSLFDALGLDRVPVVGTSLGGMWGCRWPSRRPIGSPRWPRWASRRSRSPACTVIPSSPRYRRRVCVTSSPGSARRASR
jgi:pimeloyl-ACP methyl ester carboxylesterase